MDSICNNVFLFDTRIPRRVNRRKPDTRNREKRSPPPTFKDLRTTIKWTSFIDKIVPISCISYCLFEKVLTFNETV